MLAVAAAERAARDGDFAGMKSLWLELAAADLQHHEGGAGLELCMALRGLCPRLVFRDSHSSFIGRSSGRHFPGRVQRFPWLQIVSPLLGFVVGLLTLRRFV